MTLNHKLSELANPSAGFMQNIRLLENLLAGLSFANGWVACPPPAPRSDLKPFPPMPVSGYGTTRDLALQRLMMEAVERSSSVYIGSEDIIRLKAEDLDPVHLRSFLYSDRQYASRANIPFTDPRWIPEPLKAGSVIGCVNARSLRNERDCFIPAAAAYLGYAAVEEPVYTVTDSNGCAAAQTHNEALFRGMLEIIERDALSIWWFNRIARPALSFEDDEILCAIRSALKFEHRSLRLLDLTHDLGVPVVASLTADSQGGRIYVGAAADVCQRKAARKAACEMLQFWLWGRVSVDPPGRAMWLRDETFNSQPWLQPVSCTTLHPEIEVPTEQALQQLVAKLINSGCEPVFVDLTRPWFQIPVVKIIAGGMRSLSSRFAPGRLFDVPVKLGWLVEPTSEDQLTPYPCPI